VNNEDLQLKIKEHVYDIINKFEEYCGSSVLGATK